MREPELEPIPAERDFGGIHMKAPREIRAPASIEELAEMLAYYNERSVPVTIRNTGHSVNGQSVTDGVQIHLSGLSGVRFEEENMLVHAGAGCSWHNVMQAIRMPEYCTPVFPNNPRQEIHIGGTAAVGGIGFFSSKYGGFWETVESLKLVTMQGEIIECSRNKRPELFAFSLGGFGRIGVIAEVSVRVQKTENPLLGIALGYHSEETLMKNAERAMKNPLWSSVLIAHHPFRYFEKIPPRRVPCLLTLTVELEKGQAPEEILRAVRAEFGADFAAYVDVNENVEDMFDIRAGFKKQLVMREELVYWYPNRGIHDATIANPWSDYILPHETYSTFVQQARSVINRYRMRKYLLPERINHFLTYHLDGSYVFRRKASVDTLQPIGFGNIESAYDFAYLYGIMPVVPISEAPRAVAMVQELTDLAFSLGGIRYLYGIHSLTREQVEKQYGKERIDAWREIKSATDPKNLLNRGVIPHLDD
jgi:FAD/FMN-containing dehydrogenase